MGNIKTDDAVQSAPVARFIKKRTTNYKFLSKIV